MVRVNTNVHILVFT